MHEWAWRQDVLSGLTDSDALDLVEIGRVQGKFSMGLKQCNSGERSEQTSND
jgi:hypothetical protein